MAKGRKEGGWRRRDVLGLGVGGVAALYGLVAVAMGRAFLPGYRASGMMVGGASGLALAGAYLAGGLYLVLRWGLEGRLGREAHGWAYAAENLLLTCFVAALVYVLLSMGALGLA